jgi:hypothetical protein
LVLPVRACGPEEVIVSATFLPVLPELAILLEGVDRGWIGVTLVKRAYLLPNLHRIRSA